MMLQAVNVRHHKVGEVKEPAMYRITDHLVRLHIEYELRCSLMYLYLVGLKSSMREFYIEATDREEKKTYLGSQ